MNRKGPIAPMRQGRSVKEALTVLMEIGDTSYLNQAGVPKALQNRSKDVLRAEPIGVADSSASLNTLANQ